MGVIQRVEVRGEEKGKDQAVLAAVEALTPIPVRGINGNRTRAVATGVVQRITFPSTANRNRAVESAEN